jgi:adenine-specific DNA-methyltransferase
MIKYIGSKRLLVPHIVRAIEMLPGVGTVLDLFSGTSRVGHALKRSGYRVIANDHNAYAHTLARCYVGADAEDVRRHAALLADEFNGLRGSAGYFTTTFCEQARFFHPRNGERIDAIREAIAAKSLGPELEAVMLVSLMEAADRVDSTTGVQMAYLKAWAPRALNELCLRVPDVLPRARRTASRPWTPRRCSRPMWPTSIHHTTSIPISGTTTSGKHWCDGTSPHRTGRPANARIAGRAGAPSTPAPAFQTRSRP